MSRARFRFSAVIFAIGLGGLVAAAPPKEPTHDGKSLSEWVKSLSDGDEATRGKAWQALREMSGHSDLVVEKLVAIAADPNNKSGTEAVYLLSSIGGPAVPALTQGLWSDDPTRRKACLLALQNIGADARSAAPSVVRLLGSPETDMRVSAVQTLEAMSSHSSVSLLTGALDDSERTVRLAATLALIQLGADSKRIIPVLSEVLGSSVPAESTDAEVLLGLLGPEAAAAVPAIAERLAKAKPEDARRMAIALGHIGPAAKDAVPALKAQAAEKDQKPTLRRDVGVALWLISRDPAGLKLIRDNLTAVTFAQSNADLLWRLDSGPETVAALEKLLKTEDPLIAIAAAGVLGTRSKDAVPLLGKMLAHKEAKVRASAVVALNHLGPSAKAALEPLKTATKDDSPQIAFWATVALCRVEPKPEAVANLAGYLSDRNPTRRRDAIEALGLLVTSGKPAVSKLVLLLDDEEEALRLAAAVALWKIEKHPLALPAVTKLLNSADPRVREQAAVELGGTFGPHAKPAVSDLVKRLFDARSSIRSAVAEALGRIGPAAKEAAPALLAVLNGDEPWFVQSAACEALGLIQPDDKDAATALLKKKLTHPDPLTRVHAALALFLIAGDKSGEKEAERGLGYRTYQVRITSAEALWRMKQDERAVPLLVRALEESNLDGTQGENERYMAARALGRIGPAAKPSVPELMKLLSHHDAALAATAAAALKSIDPEAAKNAGVK